MPDANLGITRTLVPGRVVGPALVLDEPLSFWGGLDPETGLITDRRHPQLGQCVSGRVLIMAAGRGSSSAASILAEAIRCGTAPCGLVMSDADEIIVLGAIVTEELYGTSIPIVLIAADSLAEIVTGQTVVIDD